MSAASIWLEEIERAAWADLYALAPAPFALATGLTAEAFDDGLILALKNAPQTQFNRVLGYGTAQTATPERLSALTERLRTVANPNHFIHLAPFAAPADLAEWLPPLGYRRYPRPWAKFWRGAAAPPAIPTTLRIVETTPDRAMDFAKPVAEGFGAPPPFQAWLGAMPGRAGWRNYAAYDGEEPVAGGAMFVRGNTAWLGVAATRPGFRGRGAQGALMARRIADAIAAGCARIATETGVPMGNEANPSFDNMIRCGFRIGYLRDNYILV